MARKTPWPNYAGLRYYAKARSTGTIVMILNGEEAGLDTSGGPWSIMCDTHGAVIAVDTLKMARAHVSEPEFWCDVDGGCIELSERS